MLGFHGAPLQGQHLAWRGHLLAGQAPVVQAEVLAVSLREPYQQALSQLHTLGMDPVASLPFRAVDHGWLQQRCGVVGVSGVGVHLAAQAAFNRVACLGLVLLVLFIVRVPLSLAVVLQLVGLAAEVQLGPVAYSTGWEIWPSALGWDD